VDRSAEIGVRVLVLARLDDADAANEHFGCEGAFEAFERSVARDFGVIRHRLESVQRDVEKRSP
jgi:hypothetical protein